MNTNDNNNNSTTASQESPAKSRDEHHREVLLTCTPEELVDLVMAVNNDLTKLNKKYRTHANCKVDVYVKKKIQIEELLVEKR